MTSIPEQINERFLKALKDSDEISEAQLEALSKLLASGDKVKHQDITKILTSQMEDSL